MATKQTSKIENAARLAERLASAEGEAVALAEAINRAQADWARALAEGDGKAEALAAKSLEAAQAAHTGALAKIPLMRDALQAARLEALPEWAANAEPVLEGACRDGLKAAERALKSLEAFTEAVGDIEKAHREHAGAISELRERALEVGRGGIEIAEALRFPVVTRNATAARHVLTPMRLDRNLINAQRAREVAK